MKRKNKNTALAKVIVSMLVFGTVGMIRRMIPLPSDVLAFLRGLLGSGFLYLLLRLSGRKPDWTAVKQSWKILAASGAMIGLNWIAMFEAYNYTTVATATICYYTQPVIVVLLSALFFREALSVRKWICAGCAVIGVILISDPANITARGELKGIILALCAAVLYAIVVLINSRIKGIPAQEKTILQLLSAAAVILPVLLVSKSVHAYPMDQTGWICLFLICFLHTGIVYAVYFSSVEQISASTAALLGYIDPLTAVLLSAFVMKEPIGVNTVIGAVLILGAAVMCGLEESKRT